MNEPNWEDWWAAGSFCGRAARKAERNNEHKAAEILYHWSAAMKQTGDKLLAKQTKRASNV